MKKRIALLLAVVLVMSAVLVACKDGGENPPNGDDHIYSFSYNGVNIAPGDSFAEIQSRLGNPTSYFEAASCAFDGNDKIYTYGGNVQVSVSPLAGADTVFMVTLLDDAVATPEGICVGSAKEQVTVAYGEGVDNGTSLVYAAGHTELVFLIRDGCVTSVQYRYTDTAAAS